jgi:hypothetical protein
VCLPKSKVKVNVLNLNENIKNLDSLKDCMSSAEVGGHSGKNESGAQGFETKSMKWT